MKRHYRRQLLRMLLIEDENQRQQLYLKDCSIEFDENNRNNKSMEQIKRHFNEGGGKEREKKTRNLRKK